MGKRAAHSIPVAQFLENLNYTVHTPVGTFLERLLLEPYFVIVPWVNMGGGVALVVIIGGGEYIEAREVAHWRTEEVQTR